MGNNPYPKFLIDEVSGVEMPDIRHRIWAQGYRAGKSARQVIKSVIRSTNGMVMVFDRKGEQITEYQGPYEEVKESILKEAPHDAVFCHALDNAAGLKNVARHVW